MTDEADTPDDDRRDPQAAWTNPTVLLIAAAWLASMVLAVGFVVFLARGNVDLSRRLDDSQEQLTCRSRLGAAIDVAQAKNSIAYDDYVIGLSQQADFEALLPALQGARAELDAAMKEREKTEEQCGS